MRVENQNGVFLVLGYTHGETTQMDNSEIIKIFTKLSQQLWQDSEAKQR